MLYFCHALMIGACARACVPALPLTHVKVQGFPDSCAAAAAHQHQNAAGGPCSHIHSKTNIVRRAPVARCWHIVGTVLPVPLSGARAAAARVPHGSLQTVICHQ